jgi:hypothetical protein
MNKGEISWMNRCGAVMRRRNRNKTRRLSPLIILRQGGYLPLLFKVANR